MKELPVEVRPLDPTDPPSLQSVIEIQQHFTLLSTLQAQALTEAEHGILLASYRLEDLQTFLTASGWGLLALSNGVPAGFLLASTGISFLKRHPQTSLTWATPEDNLRYGALFESGQFEYLDQIAVHRAHHRKGIAGRLHEEFLRRTTPALRLAAVLEQPIYNRASFRFFEELGYQKIGTFFTAELRGVKNVKSAVLALSSDRDT